MKLSTYCPEHDFKLLTHPCLYEVMGYCHFKKHWFRYPRCLLQ